MSNECKRCLLLAAGEVKSFEALRSCIDNLDDELKVSDEEYKRRLSLCTQCDNLISGMCLKCGCYAEYRAVFKSKSCPDVGKEKWISVL